MKTFIVVLFIIGVIGIAIVFYYENKQTAEGPKSRSKPITRYGVEHVHESQIKPPAQSVKRDSDSTQK